jgi:hypothetical protein
MKLTPVAFNPFDNPAKRAARAAGGGVQTTAPFPEKPEGHTVHSLDITDALRKSVMEQGFPQFARGGSVKASKESVKYSRGMRVNLDYSGGKVRLTPIAHNPFETKKAIRRAIHGD